MNSNRVYLLLLLSIMAAFVPALVFRDFSVDLELPFISLALDTLEKGSIYAFDAPGLSYAQTSPIYLWAAMIALSISTEFALPILLFISLLAYLIILSSLDRLLASDFRHQERLLILVGMSSMLLLDAGVLTARVDMLFSAVQLLAYAKIIKRYKLIHDTAQGQLRPKFGNLSIPLLLSAGVFISGFDALVVIVLSLIVLMAMNKELKRFFEVFRPHYFVIMLLCASLITLTVAIDGGSEATALFFDKFLSNHSLVNAFRDAPEFWHEHVGTANAVLDSASLAATGGTGILAAWFTGNDLFSIALKMFVLFNLPVGLCAVYFLVRQLVVRDGSNLKSRACIVFVLVSSLTVFLPDAEHDLYLLPAAPLLYYYVILSYRSMQERAMLRRISQTVFNELSGSNTSDTQDTHKAATPLIGYEVKSGTAFLASEEDLRSGSVQTTKPHVAASEPVTPTGNAPYAVSASTALSRAAIDSSNGATSSVSTGFSSDSNASATATTLSSESSEEAASAPAQSTAAAPAQSTAAVPAQSTAAVPAQSTTAVPAQSTKAAPAQSAAAAPVQSTAAVPAQSTAAAPVSGVSSPVSVLHASAMADAPQGNSIKVSETRASNEAPAKAIDAVRDVARNEPHASESSNAFSTPAADDKSLSSKVDEPIAAKQGHKSIANGHDQTEEDGTASAGTSEIGADKASAASSSVTPSATAKATADSSSSNHKNASLVLLDASGNPDTSVMSEEQLAAIRREEKANKARLKQEKLAREQELQKREKAISEVGSAVKRVGEIGVEMVNAAPEGSQAMLHAIAAMQGGKRIGIEITGKGYLLSALSSRTERNRLPVLLSAALILPLFAYVAMFIMYITEYGNYPIANHPMIGIGLGFLVFMCIPAAMFVANRLMIFALSILGLGTLGCVFLMSFSLPYVNSFIGIGTQAEAISERIDRGGSNVLCYFGNKDESTPFYLYDSRIVKRADDGNLEKCLANRFNVVVTFDRIKEQPSWHMMLSKANAQKIGNTYYVPARIKHTKNVPLNTNRSKATLPLNSASEGASITNEVAGKARLQLPLHQEPTTEPDNAIPASN